MDVYIKDSSKPKTCKDCDFADFSNIFPFCSVNGNPLFPEHYKGDGNKNCPLIPIKEGHGNLIDADALVSQIEDLIKLNENTVDQYEIKMLQDSIELIKKQPVLVEKEEEWGEDDA